MTCPSSKHNGMKMECHVADSMAIILYRAGIKMQDRDVQLASLCLLDDAGMPGPTGWGSFRPARASMLRTGAFVYLTLTALPKH